LSDPGSISYDRWGNLYVTGYELGKVFRFQLRPYNLEVSNLFEDFVTGRVIATISANAWENSDSYTYTLVEGPGGENNAQFHIDGNLIEWINGSSEENSVYNVRIRVTNAWGDMFEKAIQLNRVTGNYYFFPLIANP
jgi:hypothetical protein